MKKNKEQLTYKLFVIPSLLIFSLVMMVPFFQGVYYSVTNWGDTFGSVEFIGFKNYADVLMDTDFYFALVLTIVFSILSIIMINIVSLFLATLMTKNIKGVNIFRAGFFLPNLIGGLILGYIWQFIFNSVVYDLIGKSPLSDGIPALITLVLVLTWQYAGYIMMIYITAMLNIPQEIIEASDIDGASIFSKWRNIKIPMLASAFTITLFLTLTNSFKQFDVIFSLTSGGPSLELPSGTVVNATSTLAVDIYSRAYQAKELAEAQAEAVIFFLILGVISIVQVYINKRNELEA